MRASHFFRPSAVVAMLPASASAYGGAIGGITFLGVFAGMLVALVLALDALVTVRRKRGLADAAASAFSRSLAAVFLGLLVGLVAEAGFLLAAGQRYEPPGAREYERLALRKSACEGDVRALQRPLDEVERRHLGQVVIECQQPEARAVLLPVLYALYREGQHFDPYEGYTADYCKVLATIAVSGGPMALRPFTDAGLPLHCADGRSRPILTRLWLKGPEEAQRLYALLGGRGGLVAQMDGYLEAAVEAGGAIDIAAALEAGFDPHRPGLRFSPAVEWLFRKRKDCEACAVVPGDMRRVLTAAEIAQVDRLLPKPSAAELNRCARDAGPALMLAYQLDHRDPQAAAAYVAELLRLGADPGLPACGTHGPPRGIFDTPGSLSPAVLAVLPCERRPGAGARLQCPRPAGRATDR